ncbi:MAG: C25 family cysteine peptidase [candidate division WOR-3 bacterium]
MKYQAILLSVIFLPFCLQSGTIHHTFNFSPTDISFTKYHGYDVINIKGGADAGTEVGKPLIPFIIAHFVIPADAEIIGVEVLSKSTKELPGTYHICPTQSPRPISTKKEIPFVEPIPEVYNSPLPYPEKDFVFFSSGLMSGYRIAGILLNPIKYIPAAKKLILTTEITLKIKYQEGVHQLIALTEKQKKIFGQNVKALVVNRSDVERFAPPTKPEPAQACNYVIITNSSLQSAWQKLVNWKIAAGYQAQVVTTDWIYTNYSGYDNPEKIRNFLKDYFTNQGLIFAVLGGDNNIVPERDILNNYGDSTYYIASDYYYADLDGTWDGDGDHLYGELTDGVDGYCDIYVGRPPVDNTTEINYFLRKDSVYTYSTFSLTYQKLLLPSVMLFSMAQYHGRVVNNEIASMFPTNWTITRLEDQYSPATRNAINENYNLVHIAAHGDQNGTYNESGSPVLVISDINYLNNTMPTVLNSIACYSGDFDEFDDCFAEALITRNNYGCVATIMNTRYGWADPPNLGPSERLDTCFYSMLHHDTFNIGAAHALSLNHFRNLIWSGEPWHYSGLELTLFGDPEMRVRIKPGNEPFVYILNKNLADQNNNGIWEQGEYAQLTITLVNDGNINAGNVNAKLRATANGSYVTISDSLSSFGTIPPGGQANNSADPFKMTAAVNTPDGTEITFTLYITVDGGYSWSQSFKFTVGVPGLDYVTHDCGNFRFTVTRYGALGFMSSEQVGGVGFKYPGTMGPNRLSYGSFAAGNSKTYCVDQYVETNNIDDQDWKTMSFPPGRCRMYEPGPWGFDEYATACYSDSGHPQKKGLICEQYSWVWNDSTANDFVIMRFILKNAGSTTLSDMYAALFVDWDIGTYSSNYGNSETSRNLTYMYYNSSSPYMGVAVLDPPRSTPARNLVIIKNETYIAPYGGLPDSFQFKFMNRTIQNSSGTTPKDWSTCNSVGPFTLAPGGVYSVAFALSGGTDLADLQANVDTAYNRYWNWLVNVDETKKDISIAQQFNIFPNVTNGKLNLSYNNYNGDITVSIYDVSGRRIAEDRWNDVNGSGILQFTLPKLASGIYFAKVETNNQEKSKVYKLIVIR